jgi:molybdenum cofactor cytidylyltransferase
MTSPERPPRSAAVVLAAGSSQRMGRPKQLLPVHGRALLALVVEQACASSVDEVVVVLGAHADAVRARVDLGRARAVVNTDHATGMSSSLRVAIDALAEGVARAVVLLGDQPGITAGQIDELLALQADSGLPVAAMSIEGLLQPPVVLDRSRWEDLRRLQGDTGLREVLRSHPEHVAALTGSADVQPRDIDTPDDYRRLLELGRATIDPHEKRTARGDRDGDHRTRP